ncbi:MAG: HYR domain-containing protein [Saprospiraceae bacterium]|nr:HYR domain-containing protein [Saprospiraceae bacterium]
MAIAQGPPCSLPLPPAADFCEDACIYPSLSGLTGTTAGFTGQVVQGFCGVVENSVWYGFVAEDSVATITVTPSNCLNGNGLQMAIYTDCDSNPIVCSCNAGMLGGGTTPISVSVTLVAGNEYFLMLDGYIGDQCDYTIEIEAVGGATTVVDTQTVELCPNQTLLIDGVPYGAPDVVTVTLASNTGGCDTLATYILELLPYIQAEKTIEFCPGEIIVIDGIEFDEPGIYASNTPLPSTTGGCDSIITYTLEHLPQPELSFTIPLAPGVAFEVGGNDYFAPDVVQTTIPADIGCDTLVTYLLVLDQTVPDTCAQTISFLKQLGEPGADEMGEVVAAAADGHFYLAGEKDDQNFISKVTSDGIVVWTRKFRPTAANQAFITDLVEDSDGMLVGCAIVGAGDLNLRSCAFRYDPVADAMIWSRLMEQQSPEAYAILEKNPGGNFLLLTSPQLALNVDDAEIWELNRNTGTLASGLTQRYNYGISDVWNSMVIHDGALYTVGRHIPDFPSPTVPIDKMRMGLSRLDLATGAPVWSRLSHVDTSEAAILFGQDLLVHDDALFAIYNGTDADDPDAPPVFFLQKTTLDGELLWVKRYDTPLQEGILASDIQAMSDGFAVVGTALTNGSWNKIVVKTDFDGALQWAKRLPSVTLNFEPGSAFSLGQHQSVVVGDVLYLTATSASLPSDAIFLKMTAEGEAGDGCDFIESFDVLAEAVPNPVNIPIDVPVNQFIVQSLNLPTSAEPAEMPVATLCVSCIPTCDDVLDLGPDIVVCKDTFITFDAGDNFVSYIWQDGSTNSTFTTDEAGVYWVEVTDACGDTQRDSVLLTFSLVGDVKLPDTTLCAGTGITFSVPGFDTYSWSPSEGLSCDDCATVSIQPDVTTTYVLFAENAAGCFVNDTFTITIAPLETRSETIEFCPGSTVTIGGVDYDQPGTVVDTIPATTGCDTIVTYTLVLLPNPTVEETIEFCPGSTVTIGGVDYDQPGTVVDTIPATTGCDTIVTYTLVLLPNPTVEETIEFCPGSTVTIGGVDYDQPGTVVDTIPATTGCDTIVTYTLVLLLNPTVEETIEFCPGSTVTIGGVDYDQPGTVVDTIPATTGCDTIVTYTLVLLPNPTFEQTIEFCNGDTVFIGGNAYTQPGTVVVTIPATVGCDTIATYTLTLITSPNASVGITCSSSIDIATDAGTGPVVVNYNLPTTNSDCECPGIALNLTQGLPSGSLFPVTTTQVCYTAQDSCGNTASCCFNVTIREEKACDEKNIGCLKYELLNITRNSATLNLKYRIRVTNTCSNKLIYTAIQLPNGVVAVSPANNSVFAAQSGRLYDVRNPNFSPFYSIRFKSQQDSISNGESEVFEYELPPQINPAYIHVTSRLSPQIFQEAHLNTFNCPIEIVTNKPENRTDGADIQAASRLSVFPNPTTGVLFVDLSDWDGEQLHIQVFNSQAQQVLWQTSRASDAPEALYLPDGLSSGLYFLEVRRENGERQTIRFVLQR